MTVRARTFLLPFGRCFSGPFHAPARGESPTSTFGFASDGRISSCSGIGVDTKRWPFESWWSFFKLCHYSNATAPRLRRRKYWARRSGMLMFSKLMEDSIIQEGLWGPIWGYCLNFQILLTELGNFGPLFQQIGLARDKRFGMMRGTVGALSICHRLLLFVKTSVAPWGWALLDI